MLSKELKHYLVKQNNSAIKGKHTVPVYNSTSHYKDIAIQPYYHNLIILRDVIKVLSDNYMSREVEAINIDLFMLTPSISSPMGPGSDSEAVPVKLGNLKSYLTDSSQFGFEPILLNGIDRAYCYLPSLRGEAPDNRHLNQFFHCEIEIKGTLDDLLPVAEGYIKSLCTGILECSALIKSLSQKPSMSLSVIKKITSLKSFGSISFDEACKILIDSGFANLINTTEHGKDISSLGELKLIELLKINEPFWIKYYDRDRVPFYQKPDPNNKNKALNADLIFPNLTSSSFGGEILGAGQRQDNVKEMNESLKRQGLRSKSYEWYIDLRRNSSYQSTSGFGLGIERFITWVLCLDDIKYSILYPRLKNVRSTP